MAKEPEQIKEIIFKNITSENHITFLSNRIWGGIKLGGLFELSFLLETKPLPDEVIVEIGPDGAEKEISRIESNELIRINQATAYITIETLISLRDWLDRNIKELETKGQIQKRDRPLGAEKDE